MTVRVGINGFGRIGRNLFRAAKSLGADIDFVAVNDLGSIETMAHLLRFDSVLGKYPEPVKATKSGISVGGDELQVLQVRDPATLAVGRPRGRRRRRVDRHLHVAGQGGGPPRGRGAVGDRVGAERRRRRDVRLRRQSQGLRAEEAPGHLQRQLHDELLRPARQGARRRLRHRAGLDDDGPRLHRRPDARRRSAQGCPPGPGGGDQHRPDEHRGGASDVARRRVDEGQARRDGAAGAGGDGLAHRLQRPAQA